MASGEFVIIPQAHQNPPCTPLPVTAERVMQRADLDSDKPIDVCKVKARDKGKPEAEGPLAAYRALVITQKRQGLYPMPEAATPTTASA